jgi:hypothetical protein
LATTLAAIRVGHGPPWALGIHHIVRIVEPGSVVPALVVARVVRDGVAGTGRPRPGPAGTRTDHESVVADLRSGGQGTLPLTVPGDDVRSAYRPPGVLVTTEVTTDAIASDDESPNVLIELQVAPDEGLPHRQLASLHARLEVAADLRMADR